MRYIIKLGIVAIVVTIFLASISCLNRKFNEGYAEIISVSDTTLNDSSLFFGYARNVDYRFQYPGQAYEIWIENTPMKVVTDSAGYFSIKVLPGTYTLKCQSISNNWEQLIEVLKNIEIKMNQKIEIDFYIGYTEVF